jgi:hypothetical protein
VKWQGLMGADKPWVLASQCVCCCCFCGMYGRVLRSVCIVLLSVQASCNDAEQPIGADLFTSRAPIWWALLCCISSASVVLYLCAPTSCVCVLVWCALQECVDCQEE